jgi:hypothetical protein
MYLHTLLEFSSLICLLSLLILFNHLFVSIRTHVSIAYTLYYNLILIDLFCYWDSQMCALGILCVGFCMPLTYLHHWLLIQHFFAFWHCRILQIILYISSFRPRVSHLSRESWILLMDSSIRNQDLDTGSFYRLLKSYL